MGYKKWFAIVLIVAMVFGIALHVSAASDEDAYGSEWLYDEPQVISDETENYLTNLNENVFANYANKPQLAIVVVNNLPYDIDRYKRDLFNLNGIGTEAENCGMLFIFAVNDRKYGLEIGDGFEKGSLLREDLETDFITEDMKNALRAGDYDTVVLQVVQYLESLMADEENGVYAQKEAERLAANDYAIDFTVSFPADLSSLIFASRQIGLEEYQDCSFLLQDCSTKQYLVAAYSEESQRYVVSGVTEKQDEAARFHCGMNPESPARLHISGLDIGNYSLVMDSVAYGYTALDPTPICVLAGHATIGDHLANYKVSGKYYHRISFDVELDRNEAEQAVIAEDRTLTVAGFVLCVLLPAVGLGALIIFIVVKVIVAVLRSRKIKDLIERNYKYIPSAQTTKDEFYAYMKTEHRNVPYRELEKQFLALLYLFYSEKQMEAITDKAPVQAHLQFYKDLFTSTNNFQAFKSGQLVSLDVIFHKVDDARRQWAERLSSNMNAVEQFLESNKDRITHKNMLDPIRDAMVDAHVHGEWLVTPEVLEKTFAETLHKLNFRQEIERFLKEHADQVNTEYFDRERFRRELYASENYRDYRYDRHYDRSWMIPLLMMHMQRRRKEHQEELRRQEERRRAEEQRRKKEAEEAALRRATESMRSNNSSFGSGFGGGKSSGGGFKGGW